MNFSPRLFLPAALVCALAPFSAIAAENTLFFVEAGGMFSSMNKTTSSETASTSFLGTKQLIIGASAQFGPIKPGFDYTLFGYGGKDDTYKSKTLILELPYVMPFEFGELKAGVSAWFTTISGEGGNIQLNNGTGTSTFSKPGRSVTTRTLGWVVGLHRPFNETLYFDIDAHLLAPLSSRRTLNLLAQVSWRLN